jgi:FkbM family methyltransferase
MTLGFDYFNNNEVIINSVIHVGAHRGEEIFDYENLGSSEVVWIEPNPDVFSEMKTNLSAAQSSVTSRCFQYAASNSDHQNVDFHIYYGPDAGFLVGNKGCSSLLKTSGRFEDWYVKTIQVETITLDTLISENNLDYKNFDILYMDAQGSELMVLQGSENLLKNVKYIITEATWDNPDYIDNVMYDDLKLFLESEGFLEKEVRPHSSNWGDVLFVKE